MTKDNWQEVAETLSRHGLSADDIERVRQFEAEAKANRRARKVHVQAETLDFGDF